MVSFTALGNSVNINAWVYKWKEVKAEGLLRLDSLAAGFLLLVSIITFLQLPVHDLTNHRGGHQAEQLQHAKDGGV